MVAHKYILNALKRTNEHEQFLRKPTNFPAYYVFSVNC